MPSGPENVLSAQNQSSDQPFACLLSILYALFHIFICFFGPFSNLTSFFYILFIFPMNDAFFSFIQQFIQFFVAEYSFKIWEVLFKFKTSFIQNNAVLFIQKNYSLFFKVAYRTGLYVDSLTSSPCEKGRPSLIWPISHYVFLLLDVLPRDG